MEALIESFREAVRQAAANGQPLCLRGSGSKDFYGGPLQGAPLDLSPFRGIVRYEPKELVLTARAGTPLAEIGQALAANRQMLPFEPPSFGAAATLGGCVAAGLSGPRRAYQGAVRDFVLGVRMLDGRGDDLRFGGQVMKNVAGYDIPRLQTGAQGTLGVLLTVSLKVLPRPACERSLCFEMDAAMAIDTMNRLAGRPLPLSAACHLTDAGRQQLWLRLSGAAEAVSAAARQLGGEPVADAESQPFWSDLRERRLDFFTETESLWRLSLPPAAPLLDLPGEVLLDWGGAQRWLKTAASADAVRAAATAAGGHAAWLGKRGTVLPPLAPALGSLQRRVKNAFDPECILNPGRLYESL